MAKQNPKLKPPRPYKVMTFNYDELETLRDSLVIAMGYRTDPRDVYDEVELALNNVTFKELQEFDETTAELEALLQTLNNAMSQLTEEAE